MKEKQLPGTAALGDPGKRDAGGFSNITTGALTRPITITDHTGTVVYEKQTADTPKAADNHISNAGYRRVSEWSDGVASVEKVPVSAAIKKVAIFVAVAAIIVAGVSIFIARSYSAAPDAAKAACHEGVISKLPAEAEPEFLSTDILKNDAYRYGGVLYMVDGDLRSLDGGIVRDLTYSCEAYVTSSGDVQKVIASTTWK